MGLQFYNWKQNRKGRTGKGTSFNFEACMYPSFQNSSVPSEMVEKASHFNEDKTRISTIWSGRAVGTRPGTQARLVGQPRTLKGPKDLFACWSSDSKGLFGLFYLASVLFVVHEQGRSITRYYSPGNVKCRLWWLKIWPPFFGPWMTAFLLFSGTSYCTSHSTSNPPSLGNLNQFFLQPRRREVWTRALITSNFDEVWGGMIAGPFGNGLNENDALNIHNL